MENSGWDTFFRTGRVEDYLKYRDGLVGGTAATDGIVMARPVLPVDAVEGLGTGEAKPALPIDVEQNDADQDGRHSS